jgi:hypothetical protein
MAPPIAPTTATVSRHSSSKIPSPQPITAPNRPPVIAPSPSSSPLILTGSAATKSSVFYCIYFLSIRFINTIDHVVAT